MTMTKILRHVFPWHSSPGLLGLRLQTCYIKDRLLKYLLDDYILFNLILITFAAFHEREMTDWLTVSRSCLYLAWYEAESGSRYCIGISCNYFCQKISRPIRVWKGSLAPVWAICLWHARFVIPFLEWGLGMLALFIVLLTSLRMVY